MTGDVDAHEHARAQGDEPYSSLEHVLPGTILGGKYRLISEIGRGGMGSVWRAEHLGWEAPVALKIMNRDITARPEAVARFEREVRLAAGLRSPHVVQVLDHGLDEATHTPFIAMELLEGESLARRIKRLGLLSPGETFRVFSHLVRALTRAHAAGIVHRDLKPDNVFLVRNEEESLTKVLDFGVAKWTAPDVSESGLTRPGSVVGTPYYMSPEQIQGSREIDHRADLWALAAIACECLTGRRPFEAPDFAQLAVMLLGNQGRALPSQLGLVPAGFDAWFLRATDPDISRRFQTAREMAQTLAPICDVSPSSLGTDPSPSAYPFTSTRQDAPSMASVSSAASHVTLRPGAPGGGLWQRPMLTLAAVTAVCALLVTGAGVYWFAGQPSQTSQSLTPVAPAPPIGVESPEPSPNPGIRPIRSGILQSDTSRNDTLRGGEPEGTSRTELPTLAPRELSEPSSPPPRAADTDRFDREAAEAEAAEREALQREVRAKLLNRGKKSRATTRRQREARGKKAAEATPPRSRATKPAPPAQPAPESSPSLVDGRRIRTSL